MQRHALRPLSLVVCLSLLLLTTVILWPAQSTVSAASAAGAGSLGIIGKDGSVKSACPLRHTEVRGAITGFLARVTVTQIFENTAEQKIEAVYAFPLPDNAVVDDMTIQVGTRTVRGVIRKREEARALYEKARQTGHVAALLDQERPNIFTQSVANILPGEQVTVTISYLQTLEYENGAYQFVFPMVVGPRYIPGQPIGKQAGGWAPDTAKVPDASKITPPITQQGTRAGHDISIELAIDAGVPLLQLASSSHEIDVDRISASSASVKLKNLAEIPNKDFVLKYDVAGEQIADAVLSQVDSQVVSRAKSAAGGYFTLILQPPVRLPESDITPKELVFVLDTSGSMMGFPIEKAKELINRALDELYPGDTFNLITFSGDTRILFPEPVFPTAENVRKARRVLNAQHGYGGTEMMKAIRAALVPSDSQDHLRVVCFLTDGYVGNDLEIIGEVQNHPNARVFAYGIGNAVNRFLIESMARAGRGDSEIVTLNDKAADAAHRLYQRLRSPVLTDVSIDWRNLPVDDVLPKKLPDLFTGKPLVVTGRYTAAADGSIVILGKRAGEDFTREIPVHLNSSANSDTTLSSFWARRKIDDLMSQDWAGLQTGTVKPEVQNQITQLGLNYNLMTQFTSFVAVEERVVTTNGKPQRVEVPVEMPEGVSYEGVFGSEKDALLYASGAGFAIYAQNSKALRISGGPGGGIAMYQMAAPPPGVAPNAGIASGTGGGIGSGSGGGTGPGVALSQSPSPTKGPAHGKTPAFDRLDNYLPGTQSPDAKPATDRALLESKLSPAVLDTFDCWSKRSSACKIAPDGTIEVQLFLAADSPAVLDQLKSLGLLLSQARTKDKVITGRLPVDKLLALAGMESVKFIAPVTR
ncbi:MAG TPA: VIT and VWA domain-containing protein [Candidatus Binatia bacterium]|nr:VIT and VWA domain-containing protein [Candidatus Binatia bacterium]